jgi:hypothetical protein
MSTWKILSILGLLLVGGLLLRLKTDREYINLTPHEGQAAGVVLEAGTAYTQIFEARRFTISCIGLHFRPNTKTIPADAITIGLERSHEVAATTTLHSSALATTGISQVCFDPPLVTRNREPIALTVRVPATLSGTLRLQTRQPDDSFNPATSTFLINDVVQPAPLAYQVRYQYRPPITIFMGGLLILAALWLVWPFITLYAVGSSFLFILPALLVGSRPVAAAVVACVVFLITYWSARRYGLDVFAALLAAHAVAFTTWWPLHLVVDWSQIDALSGVVGIRNALLDPNQLPDRNWFGSYLGFITFSLALLGLVTSAWKHQRWLRLTGVAVVIAFYPLVATWLQWPALVHLQHSTLLVTITLAVWAGYGLQALRQYLGSSRVTDVISGALIILALLDLWQVAAQTLEYTTLVL